MTMFQSSLQAWGLSSQGGFKLPTPKVAHDPQRIKLPARLDGLFLVEIFNEGQPCPLGYLDSIDKGTVVIVAKAETAPQGHRLVAFGVDKNDLCTTAAGIAPVIAMACGNAYLSQLRSEPGVVGG